MLKQLDLFKPEVAITVCLGSSMGQYFIHHRNVLILSTQQKGPPMFLCTIRCNILNIPCDSGSLICPFLIMTDVRTGPRGLCWLTGLDTRLLSFGGTSGLSWGGLQSAAQLFPRWNPAVSKTLTFFCTSPHCLDCYDIPYITRTSDGMVSIVALHLCTLDGSVCTHGLKQDST